MGLEDASVPGELDWDTRLDFSLGLPLGDQVVQVQAMNGASHAGARADVKLLAVTGAPEGELVVALAWDAQSDVDLHVVDPAGVDVNPKNINSYSAPPPGEPPDPPGAWQVGGRMDFDSNAACVLDGKRRENAVWETAPPPGKYYVLVNLFDLCGQTRASYRIDVLYKGVPLGTAQGVLYESDARKQPPDGEAPGLYVTEFDLP